MTSTPIPDTVATIGQKAPARLALLDGLRFVAAMVVLAFHFTSRSNPSWGMPVSEVFPTLHRYTAWGYFGVDLFFVISGYVILMSTWGKDAPRFVASRFGRLMPAYWASVLLMGLLLLVLWPGRKETSLAQISANLTMLQSAFGVAHLDGVYWTLWVELRFYLLIGVFLLVGMTTQRLVAFAAIWPAIAAIAHQTGSDLVAALLVFESAPLFAAGMMIFILSRQPKNVIVWLVLLGNTALSAAWIGPRALAQVEKLTGVALPEIAVSLVLMGCIGAVALIVLTPLRSISSRWLVVIGALTYPLYLIHEYWGWWLIHRLHGSATTPVVLTITISVLVVAAWALHQLVERPVGPRLQRGVENSIRSLTRTSAIHATVSPPHAPLVVRPKDDGVPARQP